MSSVILVVTEYFKRPGGPNHNFVLLLTQRLVWENSSIKKLHSIKDLDVVLIIMFFFCWRGDLCDKTGRRRQWPTNDPPPTHCGSRLYYLTITTISNVTSPTHCGSRLYYLTITTITLQQIHFTHYQPTVWTPHCGTRFFYLTMTPMAGRWRKNLSKLPFGRYYQLYDVSPSKR